MKYRIREYSPLWYIKILALGTAVIAGAYSWMLIIYAIAG